MNLDEFEALADLLDLDDTLAAAAKRVLVDNDLTALATVKDADHLRQTVDRLARAELRIRSAFITHQPSCWEVVVGHNDHHRAPGKVQLAVGDCVRLVCSRVRVMIQVKVTRIPDTAYGYYQGVVFDQPHTSMRYRRGDGVLFSDDQAVLPSTARKSRRPIPL